jgi:hypothetical protein
MCVGTHSEDVCFVCKLLWCVAPGVAGQRKLGPTSSHFALVVTECAYRQQAALTQCACTSHTYQHVAPVR